MTPPQDLPHTLLADYNTYRRHTHSVQKVETAKRIRLKDLAATPARLAPLREMAAWCVAQGIDPRLWLYTLFEARHWLFCPPFAHLTPARHIKRYHAQHPLGMFRRRLQHERRQKRQHTAAEYDPNRDISPAVEAVKAQLARLADFGACMERMQRDTLGFHPRSRVCQACPVRGICQATLQSRLPFDIIALRDGRLSAEEAARQSAAHYEALLEGSYGFGSSR